MIVKTVIFLSVVICGIFSFIMWCACKAAGDYDKNFDDD